LQTLTALGYWLSEITDLSLEEHMWVTPACFISSSCQVGMAEICTAPRWANARIRAFEGAETCQHLPVGRTNITDAGLIHLENMTQLLYLGLRADNELMRPEAFNNLKHLSAHLAKTKVTDAGLVASQHMTQAQDTLVAHTEFLTGECLLLQI